MLAIVAKSPEPDERRSCDIGWGSATAKTEFQQPGGTGPGDKTYFRKLVLALAAYFLGMRPLVLPLHLYKHLSAGCRRDVGGTSAGSRRDVSRIGFWVSSGSGDVRLGDKNLGPPPPPRRSPLSLQAEPPKEIHVSRIQGDARQISNEPPPGPATAAASTRLFSR
jgi:hypothetical protein